MLPLVVDLIFELPDFPLDASCVLDKIYELTELCVEGYQKLVGFLGIFVLLVSLKTEQCLMLFT